MKEIHRLTTRRLLTAGVLFISSAAASDAASALDTRDASDSPYGEPFYLPSGWEAMGCYADDPNQRTLNHSLGIVSKARL